MRLKDKVAIVTGGANGIGRAIAVLFAEEGAHVNVFDVDKVGSKEMLTQVNKIDGIAAYDQVDVSDESEVRMAVESVGSVHGYIDILINCAAEFIFGTIETVTKEHWEKLFAVNVIGYANCAQAVIPYMKQQGGGAIVNIASVSALVAEEGHLPYSVSKAASLHFSRCLALDVASYKIRVNAISPGPIRTRATDRHIEALGLDPEKAYTDFGRETLMRRMGVPEEVAKVALFLVSDDSSFMTGANVVVDGGMTIR